MVFVGRAGFKPVVAATKTPEKTTKKNSREKLIEAALKLMSTSGIESVSLSDIASEAGITRRGAYYHFKNREQLIEAVKAHVDQMFMGTDIDASIGQGDIYSYPAHIAADEGSLFRLRLLEMLEKGPEKDPLVISRTKEIIKLKKLPGGLSQGVDPHMAGILTSSALVAAYLAVKDGKSSEERHLLADLFGKTYYQYLYHGVLKPELFESWPPLPNYSQSMEKAENSRKKTEQKKGDKRSARTRASLIKATMGLWVEAGEEGVSVAKVARLAGVTRPAAYYHFDSKEALMAAVREKLDGELLYTIDRTFVSREPFADVTDFTAEDPEILLLRVKLMLDNGVLSDPLMAYQKRVFAWHKQHGHLREGVDPEMAAVIAGATSLVSAVMAISEAGLSEARHRIIKRFGKTYGRFLFYGILDEKGIESS